MGVYIGIDPGVNGGLAAVSDTGHLISAWRMPEVPREAWLWLIELAYKNRDIYAIIEKVHSMPKQGVRSTFTFGYNAGLLEGLLVGAKIPYTFVSPVVWQRHMKCLTRGDKKVTKKLASQLFPGIKVTNCIADALLIADYCREKNGRQEAVQAGD